jgi:hypothetical protein
MLRRRRWPFGALHVMSIAEEGGPPSMWIRQEIAMIVHSDTETPVPTVTLFLDITLAALRDCDACPCQSLPAR